MLYDNALAEAEVPFTVALAHGDPTEFCKFLHTESPRLHNTGLSQAVFVTFCSGLIDDLSRSTITFTQADPELVIQALATYWDGSQLTESVSINFWDNFYTTLETAFDGDRTKFVTQAMMDRMRAAEPLVPTVTPWRYMVGTWGSLDNADNDYKQNTDGNFIVNSADPGVVTRASLPPIAANVGFGHKADYGLGVYGQLPDPQLVADQLALMPAGNRILFSWYMETRYPYQQIKITSAGGSPTGTFTLKFTPAGGSPSSASASIDVSLPVVSTLADGATPEASQLQILIRKALIDISELSAIPTAVYMEEDQSDKSVMSVRVFFFNPERTGGGWSYPESPAATAVDVGTGFDFTDAATAGGDATIDRNDGGSWITDGYSAGGGIRVVGANTSANSACYEIKTVTAGTLTINSSRVATSPDSGVDAAYLNAALPDDFTTDGGDTGVSFRSTGFGVPTLFTAEASLEPILTHQDSGLSDAVVTITRKITAGSGSNLQDSMAAYDLTEDDGSVMVYGSTTAGSGRSCRLFKLTNHINWLNPVMEDWYRELFVCGGADILDWVVADFEDFMTAPAWLDSGSAKPDDASSSTIWDIMGDRFSPGQGSHAPVEFWTAWALTDTFATYWKPYMSTADADAYDDTPPTQTLRYPVTVAGRAQLGREFTRGLALTAEYAKSVLYDAAAVSFPNVDACNWKLKLQSSSMPISQSVRELHGIGAPGGNMQIDSVYHGHSTTAGVEYTPQWLTQIGEAGGMPLEEDFSRTHLPQSEVVIEHLERSGAGDDDGEVTATIFSAADIAAESAPHPSRKGNEQGFNGIAVGHWVTGIVDNINSPGDVDSFIDDDPLTPTNSGVSILNPGIVTEVGSVVDGAVRYIKFSTANTGNAVAEIDLGVGTTSASTRVQIFNSWDQFMGNMRRMRAMFRTSRIPVAVWMKDHISKQANELQMEFLIHCVLHGVKRFRFYNQSADNWKAASPADAANSQLLFENMLQSALEHVNEVMPFTGHPLGLNYDIIDMRQEFVPSGILLSNGNRLFRCTLKPADDGVAATAPTTPGIFDQTFSDRVQFVTRNGEIIEMPGPLVSASVFNTFGFWTLVALESEMGADADISALMDGRADVSSLMGGDAGLASLMGGLGSVGAKMKGVANVSALMGGACSVARLDSKMDGEIGSSALMAGRGGASPMMSGIPSVAALMAGKAASSALMAGKAASSALMGGVAAVRPAE